MRILEEHSATARDLVGGLREWSELVDVLRGIGRDHLVGRQLSFDPLPRGGQTSLRSVLKSRFEDRGWSVDDPGIFRKELDLPTFFRVNFRKGPVGVIVSTQNEGYLVRNLTNLQLAAGPEAPEITTSVELGVLLLPTEQHKAWSRMDSSVATFEDAVKTLHSLRTLLTAPISIVGLAAAEEDSVWEAAGREVFPGKS
jgi:hypothetical protein